MKLKPFSLENESCFLGRHLRAWKSSLTLSALPSDCSQRWLFPSVLTIVVPLGVLISEDPSHGSSFWSQCYSQCPNGFSSLQFLQDLMRSSTCIVPTPFIALFCFSAIKGSINSYLAMSELPKGVFPIAIPKSRCKKDLVIALSSFRWRCWWW